MESPSISSLNPSHPWVSGIHKEEKATHVFLNPVMNYSSSRNCSSIRNSLCLGISPWNILSICGDSLTRINLVYWVKSMACLRYEVKVRLVTTWPWKIFSLVWDHRLVFKFMISRAVRRIVGSRKRNEFYWIQISRLIVMQNQCQWYEIILDSLIEHSRLIIIVSLEWL